MPQSKPPLRLVPSGAKLSEVVSSINVLAAIFMPFVILVISEHPRLKREMLELLRKSRAVASGNQQAVFDEAISFVERIATE